MVERLSEQFVEVIGRSKADTHTFQNLLSRVNLASLIGVYEIGHCLNLRICLVPAKERNQAEIYMQVRSIAYGFVSWLSKGLTSLPVNMLANTKYLSTWIRCGEPASS